MRQSVGMRAPVGVSARADPRLLRVAAAIDGGDLPRACRLLEGEVRRAPASIRLRLQLARLKEAARDREGAAAELTRVLRLSPGDAPAAQSLGRLLSEGRLTSHRSLDPIGFAASLAHRTVDRDLLGAAALELLINDGCLTPVFAHARSHDMPTAVRAALNRRSAPLLRDPLLLSVLEHCTVANIEVERLLTVIRRTLLLELPRERLAEPDLARFTTALAIQCSSNEYVFSVDADEMDALAMQPSTGALLEGDNEAGREHLLCALYRNPLLAFPDAITAEALAPVRPKPFSLFLQTLLRERDELRSLFPTITRIGSIEQPTSLKVKAQYETHPYPRWQGMKLYSDGSFFDYLSSFFTKRELAFLEKPFELLVAGCGTVQAVSAARDYGENARVTGLDISLASLGYAALMARRLEVGNLSLALGDISKIETFEPSWKHRFQMVECGGVLHHMADPFAAWRGLLDCLAPGGLMLIGLYSELARRDLATLREQPEYPGSEADDDALRRYRAHLVNRGPGAPGANYLKARDTFTTSGFRDFFLHVSEKTTNIGEIKRFLDENGLAFRGFVSVPFGMLKQRFPTETWPGSLDRWADLERERPNLFIGMYQFWLTRQ
ncbi:MAG: methyltransferase domain-containing protein [Hyphomicrobiaceae bacterium]